MLDLKEQHQLFKAASRHGIDAAIRQHSTQLTAAEAQGLRSLTAENLENLQNITQRIVDSGVDPTAVEPMCDNTFC